MRRQPGEDHDGHEPGPRPSELDAHRLHGVTDAGFAVTHNFGMLMRDDGYLELINGSNSASQYDEITGIGPGVAGGTQPQCNFVGPPAIPSLGGPILPNGVNGNVNQAFFEWFGIPVVMPYYGNAYPNAYDMPGVIVHFYPGGSGSPAGSEQPLPGLLSHAPRDGSCSNLHGVGAVFLFTGTCFDSARVSAQSASMLAFVDRAPDLRPCPRAAAEHPRRPR